MVGQLDSAQPLLEALQGPRLRRRSGQQAASNEPSWSPCDWAALSAARPRPGCSRTPTSPRRRAPS
eukprot:4911581-Pyramimonas_sp.AAC.1